MSVKKGNEDGQQLGCEEGKIKMGEPGQRDDNQDQDWKEVRTIRILEMIVYHESKCRKSTARLLA